MKEDVIEPQLPMSAVFFADQGRRLGSRKLSIRPLAENSEWDAHLPQTRSITEPDFCSD